MKSNTITICGKVLYRRSIKSFSNKVVKLRLKYDNYAIAEIVDSVDFPRFIERIWQLNYFPDDDGFIFVPEFFVGRELLINPFRTVLQNLSGDLFAISQHINEPIFRYHIKRLNPQVTMHQ